MHQATYYDGKTARARTVAIRLTPAGVEITPDDGHAVIWPLHQLAPTSPPSQDEPLRLTCDDAPQCRLIIPPGPIHDTLIDHVQLTHRRTSRSTGLRAIVFSLLLALLAVAAGYGALTLAPGAVAGLMPQSMRERLARTTEQAFIKNRRQCVSPTGQRALDTIASRLLAGMNTPVEFSVRVYRMPIVNAFALPGGRIVITDKLIAAADNADEVAGVLAHELGHVAYRHPEANFVRVAGLQVLATILTGSSGGDTLTSIAGLLTLLSYSRQAERQADAYAIALLRAIKVDPAGLRRFFVKLAERKKAKAKKRKQASGKTFGALGNILSTHPGIENRIKAIEPLAPGIARPVVDATTFAVLKTICARTR